MTLWSPAAYYHCCPFTGFNSNMLNRQFKHYVYTLVWSLDDTLYLLSDITVKVREL